MCVLGAIGALTKAGQNDGKRLYLPPSDEQACLYLTGTKEAFYLGSMHPRRTMRSS